MCESNFGWGLVENKWEVMMPLLLLLLLVTKNPVRFTSGLLSSVFLFTTYQNNLVTDN